MKRIFELICVFFILLASTANAAYTGADIYNISEKTFLWADENISPLGDTDSVAADYCVMAFSRAGKAFDYKKYIKITDSKAPVTNQDAFRIIMANAAAGGKFSDEKIEKYAYAINFKTAQDKASALIAILSGEYQVKSDTTDIDHLAVSLMEMQNTDGGFEGDILSTAKSIIALSFLSGKCYMVKGDEIGEKFSYDVNASILRGVNYLQNNKNTDYGFGSVINNAYVIMALDSAGVDSDNDPGFSDGSSSTFSALISACNNDGSFGDYPDDTAIAMCALVSHLRAMQGNSAFFALRTEDMPYNPNDYIEDINRSGEGLKIETQDEIEVSETKSELMPDPTENPQQLETTVPAENEPYSEERKPIKVWTVLVIIATILLIAAAIAGFVMYFVHIRPKRAFYPKESEEEDD